MNKHVANQGAHIASHGLVAGLQVEATQRGHGNRTSLTGAIGGLGLVVGTFFSLPAVLVLGGIGAIVGYGIGDAMDEKQKH